MHMMIFLGTQAHAHKRTDRVAIFRLVWHHKKAPATHQLCSKTIGKMLLEVDLWGPFLGRANHQENYKLTDYFFYSEKNWNFSRILKNDSA